MKIHAISHTFESCTRQRKGDVRRVLKNTSEQLHPFPKEREYKQALNAVKLDRLFAKPFVTALEGHRDAVQTLRRHITDVSVVASGSACGELIVWNLSAKKAVFRARHADTAVRDLCLVPKHALALSCGSDGVARLWAYDGGHEGALKTYDAAESLAAIDHCKTAAFITAGETVCLWEYEHDEPVMRAGFGVPAFRAARMNPTEADLFVAAASTRAILLGDIRQSKPAAKTALDSQTNSLSWNPMRPMYFCAGCDDGNSYVFDIRKLQKPIHPLLGHTRAVIGCEYSPTGLEIATCGYDKTLRIFGTHTSREREIYYTPRMERVLSVAFSTDSKYLLSGSGDAGIRIWKTNASDSMTVKSEREKVALEYKEKLKKRYMAFPEIHRIATHRHLPRTLRKQQKRAGAARTANKARKDRTEAAQKKKENLFNENLKILKE
eukprot:GHVN01063519.1.p1 GENE.GHVN01063519.1~~GHVN01063519.1.p1  ORF type:complete len:437 (-),score=18.43 GHVN01063519.1:11-1321(-)